MTKESVPAAQLFSYWLSEVAYDAREQARANRELIAGFAGVTTNTVKRFEEGGQGTGATVAKLIAAYAQASGLADGRELYQRAVDRWYSECDRPLTRESVAEDAGDGWLERSLRRTGAKLRGGPRRPR